MVNFLARLDDALLIAFFFVHILSPSKKLFKKYNTYYYQFRR
ncbi:hypothetical protein DOT_1278 [Desulfosporosinus sp. OT]|nr:hypothetical protein DOT_1278 [Desulfosporosinus sp. OT]